MWAAFDVETGIKARYKRLATPFGGLNQIVAAAAIYPNDEKDVWYFGIAGQSGPWFRAMLQKIRLLVGMNMKFDLLHVLQDPENYAAWQDWIVGGGQVWDIQLAEYLLEGMEQASHMLSLDEIAPRYGGDVKIDEVKLLWEAGVETYDIDRDLLIRYLAGEEDEPGDIQNTAISFRGQLARARDTNQMRSIMLNMGALVAIVEIELNGMFVDKPLGMEMAAKLEVVVAEATDALNLFLPTNLPFEFNWGSPKQKSALLFGGTVPYPCRQYDLKDGSTTWDPPAPDTASLYAYCQKTVRVATGEVYKSGKNKGEPKFKNVTEDDLDKPKTRMMPRLYHFPGYTKPLPRWESETEPGVYSTDKEVMEVLEHRDIPFIQALVKLQKLVKDLGTYYYRVDAKGKETGMLLLVDDEGIIHHKINQTSTVTGRLSSSDPNLQNLPKGGKSAVKALFKSRFPGGKIVQSDFSSLEIYIQAILTKCTQLIEDLKAGLDMHVNRLASSVQGEGKPYEELLKLCKGYTDDAGQFVPPVPEWDAKRTGAKVFSFRRAYGAGAETVAEGAGLELSVVEALIEGEEARYPETKEYFDKRIVSINADRRPAGRVVPHPDVRGVMCSIGKAYSRTPDGKLYTYFEQPAPDYLVRKGIFASFSPTQIKNFEVQGGGAEWAKAALWLTVRAFYATRNFGGLGLLVNQVHDAEYVDAHPSVLAEAAGTLHACMSLASEFMEWYFNWPQPVLVPTETVWGDSMADENAVPAGVISYAELVRPQIKERFFK